MNVPEIKSNPLKTADVSSVSSDEWMKSYDAARVRDKAAPNPRGMDSMIPLSKKDSGNKTNLFYLSENRCAGVVFLDKGPIGYELGKAFNIPNDTGENDPGLGRQVIRHAIKDVNAQRGMPITYTKTTLPIGSNSQLMQGLAEVGFFVSSKLPDFELDGKNRGELNFLVFDPERKIDPSEHNITFQAHGEAQRKMEGDIKKVWGDKISSFDEDSGCFVNKNLKFDVSCDVCYHVGIGGAGNSQHIQYLHDDNTILVETTETIRQLHEAGQLVNFHGAIAVDKIEDAEEVDSKINYSPFKEKADQAENNGKTVYAILENHDRGTEVADKINQDHGRPSRFALTAGKAPTKLDQRQLLHGKVNQPEFVALPDFKNLDLEEILTTAHEKLASSPEEETIVKGGNGCNNHAVVATNKFAIPELTKRLSKSTDYGGRALVGNIMEKKLSHGPSQQELSLPGFVTQNGNPQLLGIGTKIISRSEENIGEGSKVTKYKEEGTMFQPPTLPDAEPSKNQFEAITSNLGFRGTVVSSDNMQTSVSQNDLSFIEASARMPGISTGVNPLLKGTTMEQIHINLMKGLEQPPVEFNDGVVTFYRNVPLSDVKEFKSLADSHGLKTWINHGEMWSHEATQANGASVQMVAIGQSVSKVQDFVRQVIDTKSKEVYGFLSTLAS